ncbi:hypothetical protein K488DRAFT_89033 [Vararia minispora EC-137]|uniref:Uncharacterized protein n=1 Tax=Vararia minispora EC-137 TaxID=1314806 RepID=A0ACB8QBZ4_9AGAM|nr:hypothetical protein K488DRAFT_89033 [Vararia minispora EC-137]
MVRTVVPSATPGPSQRPKTPELFSWMTPVTLPQQTYPPFDAQEWSFAQFPIGPPPSSYYPMPHVAPPTAPSPPDNLFDLVYPPPPRMLFAEQPWPTDSTTTWTAASTTTPVDSSALFTTMPHPTPSSAETTPTPPPNPSRRSRRANRPPRARDEVLGVLKISEPSQVLLDLTREKGLTAADSMTAHGLYSESTAYLECLHTGASEKLRHRTGTKTTKDALAAERLRFLEFSELRYIPIRKCVGCGYISLRGHTAATHRKRNPVAHPDFDVVLIADIASSVEEFVAVLKRNGRKERQA